MDLPIELIWFLAGLALILLEFVAPGVILVFFGVGAWITGVVTWLGFAHSLAAQLLVFTGSSVLLLLTLRRRLADRFHGFESGEQDPMVNLDGFLGNEVLVLQDIAPGHRDGRVEFKGASWTAVSAVPIAAGQLATITSADGLTLHVQPLAGPSDTIATNDPNQGE